MTTYILGNGGQARVIADIIRARGEPEAVLVTEDELGRRYQPGDVVLIGIGDNAARQRVAEALAARLNVRFGTAIHPSAVIAADAAIGAGTVIMAGAVVNTGSKIGEHVIVNTNASVDHDCTLEDGSSLAPGVALGGTVQIGTCAAVGIGACVVHGRAVGEHTVVGAGAVVVEDVPAFSVAYGVPARVMRQRQAGERYL